MPARAMAKAQLRRDALARRAALSPEVRAAAAEAVAQRLFPVAVLPHMVVSGFSPVRSEINPRPLMGRLIERGARLALPTVVGRGIPLSFRAYGFGDPLRPSVFGTDEPLPGAQELAPDIVIVPLVAFDRKGDRIGYGAGYYDRTLASLRASRPIVAIGLAFAVQEIPAVPATPGDARLDLVLTEGEVIDCREG